MALEQNIVVDPPATRRLRRVAPWVLLFLFAALIVAPGIITELNGAAPAPEMVDRVSAAPPLVERSAL